MEETSKSWLRDNAANAPVKWKFIIEYETQKPSSPWRELFAKNLWKFVEDRDRPTLPDDIWYLFLRELGDSIPFTISSADGRAVIGRLQRRFGEAMWEVLKDDWVNGGYQAEAMHLLIAMELLNRAASMADGVDNLQVTLEEIARQVHSRFHGIEQKLQMLENSGQRQRSTRIALRRFGEMLRSIDQRLNSIDRQLYEISNQLSELTSRDRRPRNQGDARTDVPETMESTALPSITPQQEQLLKEISVYDQIRAERQRLLLEGKLGAARECQDRILSRQRTRLEREEFDNAVFEGELLYRLQQYDKSLPYFNSAYALQPKNRLSRWNLACSLLQVKHGDIPSQVRRGIELFVNLEADTANDHVWARARLQWLGFGYERLVRRGEPGALEMAELFLVRATEDYPNDPHVHVDLARFHASFTKKRELADREFQEAVRLAPTDSKTLGWYALYLEDTDRASATQQAAARTQRFSASASWASAISVSFRCCHSRVVMVRSPVVSG